AHGIKSAGQVTARARADLARGIAALRAQGAEAVVLGCTEMPLAFAAGEFEGLPLIDATWVLARALIRAVEPQRLKPQPPQGFSGVA
nr:aspartate/glutamate racemase family protein [Promineifilum sp.]